jgi:hypothetical protein
LRFSNVLKKGFNEAARAELGGGFTPNLVPRIFHKFELSHQPDFEFAFSPTVVLVYQVAKVWRRY